MENNTVVLNEQEKEQFLETFNNGLHRLGRFMLILGVVVLTMVPFVIGMMYGVTPDMYDAYVGELPMMMTNVDTLIIVQAKDGQVEAVETALNAYRDMMVNDTMQYPMNLGKIQASRVDVIGNFVCFIQLGADVMDALEQGDEAVIVKCQEANQTAYDAMKAVVEQ